MSELLHERIYADLLRKIKEHLYDEGDMLPTENEMEGIYNASKAPIRQALTRLHKEGFIIRKAGKGTFVAGRSSWPHVNLGGHAEEFAAKGKLLYCKTLSVEPVLITAAEEAYMQQPVGTSALYVERVRYYQDAPVHYLQHYILDSGLKLQERLRQEGNFSSLLYLYDKYGIRISKTDDELEAVAASDSVAAQLQVAEGTPLLRINRCTYRDDGSLLEFVRFYILTDNWKYRAHYRSTYL